MKASLKSTTNSPHKSKNPTRPGFSIAFVVCNGKTAEVTAFFKKTVIEDGEYYLIKAKYLFGQGLIDQALAPLEKSIKTGTLLLDAESLRRDYLYYRASVSTVFLTDPREESRKAALDGWFEVKNFLRGSPNHEYYQKAVMEMQKLGAHSRQRRK